MAARHQKIVLRNVLMFNPCNPDDYQYRKNWYAPKSTLCRHRAIHSTLFDIIQLYMKASRYFMIMMMNNRRLEFTSQPCSRHDSMLKKVENT